MKSHIKKIIYKPMDYFGVGNMVPVKKVIVDMQGVKHYNEIEPEVDGISDRARSYTHFISQNYDKRKKILLLVYTIENVANGINQQMKFF